MCKVQKFYIIEKKVEKGACFMDNVGNCPECGKLYIKTAAGMCPDCYRLEQENEDIVVSYVRDNPKSSVEGIHEATGVKEKTIFKMIKNGRFMDEFQVSYPCEQCGADIVQGRLCYDCNRRILKDIQDSQAKREAVQVKEKKDVAGKGIYTKNMTR